MVEIGIRSDWVSKVPLREKAFRGIEKSYTVKIMLFNRPTLIRHW